MVVGNNHVAKGLIQEDADAARSIAASRAVGAPARRNREPVDSYIGEVDAVLSLSIDTKARRGRVNYRRASRVSPPQPVAAVAAIDADARCQLHTLIIATGARFANIHVT